MYYNKYLTYGVGADKLLAIVRTKYGIASLIYLYKCCSGNAAIPPVSPREKIIEGLLIKYHFIHPPPEDLVNTNAFNDAPKIVDGIK